MHPLQIKHDMKVNETIINLVLRRTKKVEKTYYSLLLCFVYLHLFYLKT